MKQERKSARIFFWCWLTVTLGLWLFVFRDPLADIYRLATNDVERSYILMVPLVSLYLIYLRRSRFRNRDRSGRWVGPLVVAAGLVTSNVGYDYDHLALWHAGAVIAFIGGIAAIFGTTMIRSFAPAIIVLLAIVPIPGFVRQEVAQPLQNMATTVTYSMLDFIGVPVEKAGLSLSIKGRVVAVGEACNGMRLLLPLALVIYAFLFSLPLRNVTRLALLLASVPVAIACNVFRLVPTAIAYGYFPTEAATIHDVGGWVMIPLAIWILLMVLKLGIWLDLPVEKWRLVGS